MRAMKKALTLIWVATQGTANMKTLWKLYTLLGESWTCCSTYDNEQEAYNGAQALQNLGYKTMIRRMSM